MIIPLQSRNRWIVARPTRLAASLLSSIGMKENGICEIVVIPAQAGIQCLFLQSCTQKTLDPGYRFAIPG
jgi:hypothetical protein